MKSHFGLIAFSTLLCLTPGVYAANVGSPFYGDPPDEHHPWAIHDRNRPQPKVVTARHVQHAGATRASRRRTPSILFDGTDLSKWEADEGKACPTKWVVKDGAMECVPGSGYIRTKEKFGDCQLHVEWAAPSEGRGRQPGPRQQRHVPDGPRGGSGAGQLQQPDLRRRLRRLGLWRQPAHGQRARRRANTRSTISSSAAPIYKDGKQVDPGYVTVFANGVLVQDHTMLEGGTGHMGRSKPEPFPATGPLKLQDHGNPVRFRNIWYRPLPPRPVEGGTDGYLTAEATYAKRAEIAAMIRKDAERLKNADNPVPELLRWAESLVYEQDADAQNRAAELAEEYMTNLQQLSPEKLAAKKDEIKRLRDVVKYLTRFNIIPADYQGAEVLTKIIKDHNWDKK